MSAKKQSTFTEIEEIPDGYYVDVFGNGVNRKIRKEKLLKQLREENFRYFFETVASLQTTNLEADQDDPIYVVVAENDYQLYKITSQAAGEQDIALSNGRTATHVIDKTEIRAAAAEMAKQAAEEAKAAAEAEVGKAAQEVTKAEGEADRATSQADRAESARDASIVNAQTYTAIADGLAAVADGKTFDVLGSDDVAVYRYRRIDASTYEGPIAEFPSRESIRYVNERNDFYFPYEYIRRDDNGNIVEYATKEEGRKSLVPFTADSVQAGISYSAIDLVSEVKLDEAGNVVGYRLFGKSFTDLLADDDESDSGDAVVAGKPPIYSGGIDTVYGAAWNQWIFPTIAGCNGMIYAAPVGRGDSDGAKGDVWASQKYRSGPFNQCPIAQQVGTLLAPTYTDDHNAGAMLVDSRAGAEYPLMLFNTGHNGTDSKMRMWRSATGNLEDLTLSNTTRSRTGLTYAQAFRNPNDSDEIVLFTRTGGSGNATWWIHRSLDNGDTWSEHTLFVDEYMYFMAKPALDNSGLHLGCHQRPDHPDQRICYLKFNWSGSIENASGVYVADVYDPAFAGVEPWADAGLDTIHTPATGFVTRLFDVLETAAGIEFVWAEFEMPTDPATGYYKHALSSGGTVTVSTLTQCGNTFDNRGSDASYIAGAAIMGERDVVCAKYQAPGYNTGALVRIAGNPWVESALIETDQTLVRPVALANFNTSGGVEQQMTVRPTVGYMIGSYNIFQDYSTDIKFLEL